MQANFIAYRTMSGVEYSEPTVGMSLAAMDLLDVVYDLDHGSNVDQDSLIDVAKQLSSQLIGG